MGDCCVRVEKLENGFEVEVIDPKIAAENAKPKTDWQDPWKSYAFTTAEGAAAFVTARLTAMPKSSMEQFNEEADKIFKSKE